MSEHKRFASSSQKNMEEKFVSLSTRQGVVQNFTLIEPDDADACVILFAGGPGNIHLSQDDGRVSIGRDINFLVRSRWLFAEQGLDVAVVDAPSDRQNETGMLGSFRKSDDHVTDIKFVVGYLKEERDRPVWLVGTSRGTESAAYVTIRQGQNIAGLIFTSSIVVTDRNGLSLTDMDLDQIHVPTQILAHKEDECPQTPASGAELIAAGLVNAPDVAVAFFEGGDLPLSGPCDPLCAHGFLGIEREVVTEIAYFIRSHSG